MANQSGLATKDTRGNDRMKNKGRYVPEEQWIDSSGNRAVKRETVVHVQQLSRRKSQIGRILTHRSCC